MDNPVDPEVLPECEARRCMFTITEDITTNEYVYQHGDNPEHCLRISFLWMVTHTDADLARRIKGWTEFCHDYEEGRWSPFDVLNDPEYPFMDEDDEP